jgi:hypothetical protein
MGAVGRPGKVIAPMSTVATGAGRSGHVSRPRTLRSAATKASISSWVL